MKKKLQEEQEKKERVNKMDGIIFENNKFPKENGKYLCRCVNEYGDVDYRFDEFQNHIDKSTNDDYCWARNITSDYKVVAFSNLTNDLNYYKNNILRFNEAQNAITIDSTSCFYGYRYTLDVKYQDDTCTVNEIRIYENFTYMFTLMAYVFKKDNKVEVKVFEPDKYKGQFEDYFCHYPEVAVEDFKSGRFIKAFEKHLEKQFDY